MCTVTVVVVEGAVRLACNRDELRSRLPALPPRTGRFGPCRAVLPVDPSSGGTWVAVNDAGLAMTLLNINLEEKAEGTRAPLRSRGTIIPALLHCGRLDSVLSEAAALDATLYAPFRLVLADHEEWTELRSDGRHLQVAILSRLTEPLFFTSSGLGDHLVEGPRQRLFAEFVSEPGDLVSRQDLFHRHHWFDRPHLSVCMRRAEAQTVSHTIVSLGPDRVTLAYHPDAPDQSAKTVSVTLPITEGGIA